ncbi:MAG: SEC-C metal-binding domain-containing protein, partial [Gemmataceae bacterium]
MAVDLYAPCPCGSGKKFKWCCVDIWGQIEKVYETFSNGQAETALIQIAPEHHEFRGSPINLGV